MYPIGAIDYTVVNNIIKESLKKGQPFNEEDYYGQVIQVTRESAHHEILTKQIQKYFDLKFKENFGGEAWEKKGHTLYILHPKPVFDLLS